MTNRNLLTVVSSESINLWKRREDKKINEQGVLCKGYNPTSHQETELPLCKKKDELL